MFKKFPKNSFDSETVKKYLISLLRLYIIWTILYSPFILHGILAEKKGILLGCLIAMRNFFLTGSYTHLWYLNATLIAVVLVCLLLKRNISINNILLVALGFFLIGLLGQTYFGLLIPLKECYLWSVLKTVRVVIGTTRNALFVGFFFIAMGIFFAWNEKSLTKGFNSFVVPLLSVCLLLCEGLLVKAYGHPLEWNSYLCQPIAVFFIFRYAIDSRKKWAISDKTGKWMRDIVEIVFLLHIMIRKVADFFIPRFLPFLVDTSFRYIVVCIVSFVAGAFIIYLSKKIKFLKRLI